MVSIRRAYREYGFRIPWRVRFFNVFRYAFTIPFLERWLVTRLVKSTRFWHRLIPPLYFYPKNSLRNGIREGVLYHLDISNYLDHAVYFCSLRDEGWQNFFSRLKHNDVILDAGANIGYYTTQLARRCPEGKVYAFEPDEKNFLRLQHNVAQNPNLNIQAVRTALGEAEGEGILYGVHVNNSGANRILHEAPEKSVSQERVPITTLDRQVNKLGIQKVDVIKIDVEGFEQAVIKGATKTIQRFKPFLFVEYSEPNLQQQGRSGSELLHLIEELEYEVLDARTMKSFERLVPNYQTDLLCISTDQGKIKTSN